MITFKSDARQFNRAMKQLREVQKSTDKRIVTFQAFKIVRTLVFHTPRASSARKKGKFARLARAGRAKAGWYVAWKGLEMRGTPPVASKELRRAEGDFKDRREKVGDVHVIIANTVPYINSLDRKHKIMSQALSQRSDDIKQFVEKRYASMMRRFDG